MATTRIPVLDFHGNGSMVCLAGLKQQASSHKRSATQQVLYQVMLKAQSQAPSNKRQAPSVRQIVARQFAP